tara:strand:- start:400 stop:645 length:246 start_codon:yes stop_codon:yes gene_type:complete
MANRKNFTPKLVEGFLDKMFGKIITRTGDKVVKDMSKKDPSLGKKLTRVKNLVKDIENDMKGMSKSQKDKYKRDLLKRAGI